MADSLVMGQLRVAIVAYQGVLADESAAFRDVLGRVPRARVRTVGERLGAVGGPGGAQVVEACFDEVDVADVVAVPGGLGTHRHPEIADWLLRLQPRWVLTSSTGSALLAAAGLLRGRTAVTHWLAGPLLERHGVVVSDERLVVDPPYITCSGLSSAYDAALVVVRRVGGPSLVRDIRRQLTEWREPGTPCAAATRGRARPVERVARDERVERVGRVGRVELVEVELEETPQTRRR